jgi:hypothetical protein
VWVFVIFHAPKCNKRNTNVAPHNKSDTYAKLENMATSKIPNGRPSRAGKVDTLRREQKVMELRAQGWTWQRIADEVGYASASATKTAFDNAIKRTMQPIADEVRTLELERLDRFLSYLWAAIEQGDPVAIDKGLKIMDRRAKYLGLDAPIKQQVEVTNYEGGTEVDRELQRLISLLADSNSTQSIVDSAESPTHTG